MEHRDVEAQLVEVVRHRQHLGRTGGDAQLAALAPVDLDHDGAPREDVHRTLPATDPATDTSQNGTRRRSWRS